MRLIPSGSRSACAPSARAARQRALSPAWQISNAVQHPSHPIRFQVSLRAQRARRASSGLCRQHGKSAMLSSIRLIPSGSRSACAPGARAARQRALSPGQRPPQKSRRRSRAPGHNQGAAWPSESGCTSPAGLHWHSVADIGQHTTCLTRELESIAWPSQILLAFMPETWPSCQKLHCKKWHLSPSTYAKQLC